MSNGPTDHQSLLAAWVDAEIGLANEWSGDIAGSVARILARASAYAEANGLDYAPILSKHAWRTEGDDDA